MKGFGKYEFSETESGSSVLVEVCSQNEDFWLPVTTMNGVQLGHLFFKKMGQGLFELNQIRPVSCPIHNLSDVCTQTLCPQQEGT